MTNQIFNNNKYTKWYYKIVDAARSREITGYFEKHRIIPGCMGGKYVDGNVVKLTAREHFICHLLLTKMVSEQPYLSKLKYAAILLYWVHGQKVSSRVYDAMKANIKQTPEWIKKRTVHFKGRVSPTKGSIAWNRGKETPAEIKEKISMSLKGRTAWNKGVSQTHESNLKRSNALKGKPKECMIERVSCIHCGCTSTRSAITRYHNHNCKHKTTNTVLNIYGEE